jgi:acetate kinase
MVQLSGVPQLACCDTAFHRSRPAAVDAYALPADFFARGIRRYGFHGLACESVVRQLMAEDPALGRGRLILAHIDAATELVAVKGGRCLDGTGGFASGDGLPSLGSAGPLDAGALLHLLEGEGLAPAALARLIEEEAGLASMAGLAGGLDAIEASGAPEAAAALDHFAWRVRRSIGGLAATLGGVDAVVFSGSVGEARPALRARICAGLFFLGIRADAERNAAGVAEISPPGARVRLLVRRADPARMVADHLLATLEEAVRAA